MKRRVLAAIGLTVAVVLVLNITGAVRYPGGPLREADADGWLWLDIRPADQGNDLVGNSAGADWAQPNQDLVFSSIRLVDPWPWPATVEHVTLLGVSGSLVMESVHAGDPDQGTPSELWGFGPVTPDQQAILDTSYAPLPVTIGSSKSIGMAIVVRGTSAGPAGFQSVAVDYRVGPFSFSVVQHLALEACLGTTPEERVCPEAASR